MLGFGKKCTHNSEMDSADKVASKLRHLFFADCLPDGFSADYMGYTIYFKFNGYKVVTSLIGVGGSFAHWLDERQKEEITRLVNAGGIQKAKNDAAKDAELRAALDRDLFGDAEDK